MILASLQCGKELWLDHVNFLLGWNKRCWDNANEVWNDYKCMAMMSLQLVCSLFSDEPFIIFTKMDQIN